MNTVKFAAVLLIVAGVLGLTYGSFSWTRETHATKLGPVELALKERESIDVPVWAGVGAIALGAALLLLGGKKN